MPIIEITSLPPQGSIDVAAALARVTTEVAAYLGEDPRGTWAIWRRSSRGRTRRARTRRDPAARVASRDRRPLRRSAGGPRGADADRGRAVEAFGLDDGNVVVRLTDADDAHVWWGD